MDSAIVGLLNNYYVSRFLAVTLVATFIFSIVVSIILFYHWKRYESVNGRMIFFATIYFGGLTIFFIGALYYLFLFLK